MVGATGIEPVTFPVSGGRSPAELRAHRGRRYVGVLCWDVKVGAASEGWKGLCSGLDGEFDICWRKFARMYR
jgi:hypothetical protein